MGIVERDMGIVEQDMGIVEQNYSQNDIVADITTNECKDHSGDTLFLY